jgi:ATP-dependent helicase/nuclease subunit A
VTSERPAGRHGRLSQPSLFDAAPEPLAPEPAAPPPVPPPLDADGQARVFAADPRNNVVLEASAGTGKTSVLVARYLNLLRSGIDPGNILAITFTRKAAAEMRERIVRELRQAAEQSALDRRRWLELRDRLSEIAISTIDAFCLSLLREFPLEADVDPAFDLADETEVPRLVGSSLDRTMRILVNMARSDGDVALVLAQLGISRTREGLATLLDRRLVAWDALNRFLVRGPRDLTSAGICAAATEALQRALATVPGGLARFIADGPTGHPRYALFVRDARRLGDLRDAPDRTIRAVLERVSGHFLTNEGKARKGSTIYPYNATHYPSRDAMKRHRDAVMQTAPFVEAAMFAFNRDLNVVLARGVRRMFGIALEQYRRALEERSVLDFSDVLAKAVELLRKMDEFSQSRFRLESRYHHVLVDEFQDTSRAQWELVSLLVQAWGEGLGVATSPSIFIVGDRKQSIYRFRDAEVGVLEQAAGFIDGLRPGGGARRSIARSFRAVPELLHFVNDLFGEMSQPAGTPGEFTYDERDRFPVTEPPAGGTSCEPVLGLAVAETVEECAAAVAGEVETILRAGTIRDKTTGTARRARPGDIGILFRSRSSHREFEHELNLRGIPTYVYKGLGFFDADEIKDVVALIRYLADPSSSLRAAAFMRSRFVRLSDIAVTRLAPGLAAALIDEPTGPEGPVATSTDATSIVSGPGRPVSAVGPGSSGPGRPVSAAGPGSLDPGRLLDDEDRRVLDHTRRAVTGWLAMADRIPPAELLDRILDETGYAFELRGPRRRQAWENLKKIRSLVRRIQNSGYATLPRVAEHLMSLTGGDESNAVIEALDSVNLMTVHAAKGLEFPIVFVVNLAKGATGPPKPVRVSVDIHEEPSVSIGPFISDTDEAERERERHETRRLLYVGVTRARDRLYLSSTLKEGVFVPGRGSLAEVLPDSLRRLIGGAASTFPEVDTVGWTGVSGRAYSWRLCRPNLIAGSSAGVGASTVVENDVSSSLDDFAAPAAASARARISAGEVIAGGPQEMTALDGGSVSDRLFGIIVHRMFEHAESLAAADPSQAAALCRRLLREEELLALEDPDAFSADAARIWVHAHTRADVRDALRGRARFYEVPFSLAETTGIVRGTIDCLVQKDDGLLVLELKTGRALSVHQQQLDLYVRAASQLHGDEVPVSGLLLYL